MQWFHQKYPQYGLLKSRMLGLILEPLNQNLCAQGRAWSTGESLFTVRSAWWFQMCWSLGDVLQSTNAFRGKLLCRHSPNYEFISFCNVSWTSLLDGWLTTIMCNELIFDETIKYILSAMVNLGKDQLRWESSTAKTQIRGSIRQMPRTMSMDAYVGSSSKPGFLFTGQSTFYINKWENINGEWDICFLFSKFKTDWIN